MCSGCLRFTAHRMDSSHHRLASTAKELGDALEMRVERLFRKLGKLSVRRDVKLVDGHGNASQIDIVYGMLWPTYVECKNYQTSGKSVPLSDVAKFKEVLTLNGIPLHRGLFITTTGYVPRALTIGIRTLDGEQLMEWEKAALRRARRLVALRLVGTLVIATWIVARYAPDAAQQHPSLSALRQGNSILGDMLYASQQFTQGVESDVRGNIDSAIEAWRRAVHDVDLNRGVPGSCSSTSTLLSRSWWQGIWGGRGKSDD